MKTAYWLVAALFWLAGCTSLDQQRIRYHQLVGKWTYQDSQHGQLVLQFNKNRTYEVDFEGDGEKDIWGRIEFWREKIKLTDEEALKHTDCREAGFYDYSLTNGRLDLIAYADACQPRRTSLNLPRQRLPKNDTLSMSFRHEN